MTVEKKSMRDYIQHEIVAALESVSQIRDLLHEHPTLNANEAKVVRQALESFVNKFKLKTIQTSLESMVATSMPAKYCDSVLTALESRLERYRIM